MLLKKEPYRNREIKIKKTKENKRFYHLHTSPTTEILAIAINVF